MDLGIDCSMGNIACIHNYHNPQNGNYVRMTKKEEEEEEKQLCSNDTYLYWLLDLF